MFTTKPFISPKYWPTWVGLFFLRCCALLPYAIQMWLGRQIAYISYTLMPRRKNIVKTNIRLCFPELNPQQQRLLVKKSIASTGMAIFEIGICWWAGKRRISQLYKPEGLEHLTDALKKGKGVIILASHFTTLEIAGTFLTQHVDNVNVVYKRAHNALFEHYIKKKRTKNGATLVNHTNVREMIRKLKKGGIIWYSPDQDFGEKDSVFAPFMGVSTCTLISTQRLSQLTGASVVPFFVERPADSKHLYKFHFHPAIENYPTDDAVKDATVINAAIEKQIREAPEQYLWAHRRFKSRPGGKENIYK